VKRTGATARYVQVPFRGAVGTAAAAPATTQTNPFTMPNVYASALERKVQAVEDMRRGVKASAPSYQPSPCSLAPTLARLSCVLTRFPQVEGGGALVPRSQAERSASPHLTPTITPTHPSASSLHTGAGQYHANPHTHSLPLSPGAASPRDLRHRPLAASVSRLGGPQRASGTEDVSDAQSACDSPHCPTA
jgi:hypothetical protein